MVGGRGIPGGAGGRGKGRARAGWRRIAEAQGETTVAAAAAAAVVRGGGWMCGDLVSNHGTTGRASIEREQRPGHPAPSSPSLGTMSVRRCGAGANQPDPTHRTTALLRLHLRTVSTDRPPSPSASSFSSSSSSFAAFSCARPRPLPSPLAAAAAAAAAAATAAVTPLPPSARHPLLPTAVLRLPNRHPLPRPQAATAEATHTHTHTHTAIPMSSSLFPAVPNLGQSREILMPSSDGRNAARSALSILDRDASRKTYR